MNTSSQRTATARRQLIYTVIDYAVDGLQESNHGNCMDSEGVTAMRNYESRVQALEQKHIKEVADLEATREILDALPEALQDLDWHAHIYKLYDRSASIRVEVNRYESIRKHPDPTLDTIVQLSEVFPIVPAMIYRDGSVGIRTGPDARSEAEKALARGADPTLTPIAPIRVDIYAANYSNRVEFEWFAHVAGRTIECGVGFPLYHAAVKNLGRLLVHREGEGSYRGEHSKVISTEFEPGDTVRVINNAKFDRIRYSSGDPMQPSRILGYWDSCDGTYGHVSPADVVDRLR